MKPPRLRKAASILRRALREAKEEGDGDPRATVKALITRAAEVGVNAFFPTNGSGNNMSRG